MRQVRSALDDSLSRTTLQDGGIVQCTSFVEKPAQYHLVVMGVHMLEPDVSQWITAGVRLEARELMRRLLDGGVAINSDLFDGHWPDMDQPRDFEKDVGEFDAWHAPLFDEGP